MLLMLACAVLLDDDAVHTHIHASNWADTMACCIDDDVAQNATHPKMTPILGTTR
jgi:hypothetical protein